MSGGGGVGGGDLNDLSGSSSGATPSSGGNSKRLSSKISRYGLTGGSFRERFGRSGYTNAILFRLFFSGDKSLVFHPGKATTPHEDGYYFLSFLSQTSLSRSWALKRRIELTQCSYWPITSCFASFLELPRSHASRGGSWTLKMPQTLIVCLRNTQWFYNDPWLSKGDRM